MHNASPKVAFQFEDEPIEDGACIVDDELPLLASGVYEAAFDTWETVSLFGGRAKKLVLWFTILDAGEMGKRVPRYYNVRQIVGKPRRRGLFKVGRKSEFLRDYCALHGAPARMDRISVSHFAHKRYQIKVRTVTKGANQRDIHEALQYSVIDRIMGVEK